MNKILLIITIISFNLQAEQFRVYFNDKGTQSFEPDSEIYKQTLELFSKKAIERRKAHHPDNFISLSDAPIFPDYLNELNKIGDIILQNRWFNYIVFDTDQGNLEIINKFDFVKEVQPIFEKTVVLETKEINHLDYILADVYNYGKSTNQIEMLNIPPLHKMGFNGENSQIGFLDAGYDPKLALARFPENNIENYDFVGLDSNVSFEEGDPVAGSDHGTSIMSTVIGYLQDSLVGVSTASKFMLTRTENTGSETLLEVDNFAKAVEWLEAKGCDVINSSLGYKTFNSGQESYVFDDLNGKTTLLSKVINQSVHWGVVHTTSAGNSGNKDSTLISPADADSVLSVAGVTPEATEWSLSSRGPRKGGGVFPNIAAQGSRVAYSATKDLSEPRIRYGAGTSFAAPIIAGCVSLLRSAFPERKAYEIRDILFKASSNYETPNNVIGYGYPDMVKAFELAGVAISKPSHYQIEGQNRLASYIFSSNEIDNAIIGIYDPLTKDVLEFPLNKGNGNIYFYDIFNKYFESDTAKYFLKVSKNGIEKRLPYKEGKFLTYVNKKEEITCGVDALELPTEYDPSSVDNSTKFDISYQNGIIKIIGKSNINGNGIIELYDLKGKMLHSEGLDFSKENINLDVSQRVYPNLILARISGKDFHILEKIIKY